RVSARRPAKLAEAHAIGAGGGELHVLDHLFPVGELVVGSDPEPDKLFRCLQGGGGPHAVAADRNQSEERSCERKERRRGTPDHSNKNGPARALFPTAALTGGSMSSTRLAGSAGALEGASRMDRIQAPIVPIVGALIREVPGTISLGQGVVHYGPPPAAIDAIREVLDRSSTHEYCDGAGLPMLVDAIARKLAVENGIDVAQGGRIMVTAGANMAFMHAVLAITTPGDEIILPVPFYFNHDMAIEMAGC